VIAKVEKERPIRTALIGYGLAGSVFHAPLIDFTAGLTLSAVVTGNPERQRAAKDAYPSVKTLASTDELFKDASSYDLVVVATPNDSHAPLAKASMEAGLAVVVDKPFALSVAEAEEVIAVQEKTGALLSVFQNRRWDNDFLTVRELIETGTIGKILRIESRFERWRPTPKPDSWREKSSADMGGGLLFDLGSHLIDQALVLFGQPRSVYAQLKTRRQGVASDDDTFVALEFDNDVCFHIWVNQLSRLFGPRFRVLGSEGAFEKFGLDPQESALRSGERPGHSFWGVEETNLSGQLSATVNGIDFSGTVTSKPGSYEVFYSLMHEAILHGSPVPVAPKDAVTTLKVIEAARQSAATGTAVRL